VVGCWVLALLSAAMSADAAWHLVGTHQVDPGSLSNGVRVASDLQLVALVEYYKDHSRTRVVVLSASGDILSTFSPGAERGLGGTVWLNAERGQARVLVFSNKRAPDGGPSLVPPHLLTLEVKTGKTLHDLALERLDFAVQPTRDGREMVIYSHNDRRIVTEDGKVLCHLGALDDPLPKGAGGGGPEAAEDWPLLPAPQGGYLLTIAPNGKDIYQVTSKGDRYWELHLSDLFAMGQFAPVPQMAESGRYLLVGNTVTTARAAQFSLAPKKREWPNVYFNSLPLSAKGWSLTLVGIQDEAGSGVPGGKGRIVWGTLRLQDHADPLAPAPYTLGPVALEDRLSLVTVAAWESGGIWLWDITPKGRVQNTGRITPNLPPTSVLNEMHLAGDPPVLLVPYESREPKEVGALWLSTDGKELFRWSTPGTDCEGYLSTDGHRAMIRSHTAVHMFTDE